MIFFLEICWFSRILFTTFDSKEVFVGNSIPDLSGYLMLSRKHRRMGWWLSWWTWLWMFSVDVEEEIQYILSIYIYIYKYIYIYVYLYTYVNSISIIDHYFFWWIAVVLGNRSLEYKQNSVIFRVSIIQDHPIWMSHHIVWSLHIVWNIVLLSTTSSVKNTVTSLLFVSPSPSLIQLLAQQVSAFNEKHPLQWRCHTHGRCDLRLRFTKSHRKRRNHLQDG